MAQKDGCGKCDHDGFCYCHAGKVIVGVIIGIIALLIVLWLVRAALGIVLGVVPSTFWVHLILGIIVLIFILWLIAWAIGLPFRLMHGHGRRDIRILRRRYARGEISEAQFRRMMKNLKEE